MAKKKIKKAVKKVLDKTELDEKIVDGYVLALLAGCTFGVSFWWGLGLLIAAGAWAYWQVCKCKACKVNSSTCCN